MKLIVGLGNPGRKYQSTRHNVGFECVSAVARLLGVEGQPSTGRFDADLVETRRGPDRVLLVRPLTFMNLSGEPVRRIVDFFRIPLPDLLVICDDLALPVGSIRLRSGGTAGGQKGLQNVCDRLGSTGVPRLRIGIGACPPGWDAADYVLARIPPDERPLIDESVQRGAQAALCWLDEGIATAMNQFNRKHAGDSQRDGDGESKRERTG